MNLREVERREPTIAVSVEERDKLVAAVRVLRDAPNRHSSFCSYPPSDCDCWQVKRREALAGITDEPESEAAS